MDLIVWRFNRKMYAYVEHLLKSRFNAVFATTGESQIARSFFFVARVRKWTANANRTRKKTKNLLWLRSWSSCADEMGKKCVRIIRNAKLQAKYCQMPFRIAVISWYGRPSSAVD